MHFVYEPTEAVRKTFRALRSETWWRDMIIAVFVSFMVLVLYVFFEASRGHLQNQLKAEQRARQTEISGLSVLLTPTATPTISIAQAISEAQIRKEAERLATATPTKWYSIEIKYGATTLAGGNFELEVFAAEDRKGVLTAEAVNEKLGDLAQAVTDVCRFNSMYRGPLGFSIGSSGGFGRSPIDSTCWSMLEKITGVKASERLPQKVVNQLQGISRISSRTSLFISNDGKILGKWNWSWPSVGNACFDKALTYNGYTGGGYFVVAPFDTVNGSFDGSSTILHEAGFDSDLWPTIPDFCQSANMVETQKPDWLSFKEGLLEVGSTLTATIRFYNGSVWVKAVIRGEDRLIASAGENDLLLIDNGRGYKLENLVYLNVREDKITWYRPVGLGDSYGDFQAVPAIWLSPMVDGISPWISPQGVVSPYVVGEKIIIQQGARSSSFK